MTKRLLIVDDEETLTFSLYQSFILSDKDYEVITADSGEEAIRRIQESAFDLVITDIFMPGISGVELLERIKKEWPTTEVIVMTAYGSETKKDEVEAMGARHYFEKPFEIKELRARVFDILG